MNTARRKVSDNHLKIIIEVVCNPLIVCVNHKFREFKSITVGLGRKKTMIDLNSHQTKIYEHEWYPS